MPSRRLLKAAEAIREVVSMAILTEIRDPRVQNVTVTGVEVAPDMRTAKVLVSVMGTDSQQELCLRGLQRSSGFLQSKIAKRIDTRYTPRLTFEMDLGVKKSLEVARILQELADEREQLAATAATDDDSPTHASPASESDTTESDTTESDTTESDTARSELTPPDEDNTDDSYPS